MGKRNVMVTSLTKMQFCIIMHCILSICNIYLFPVLVLRAGFCLLIAPVPVHCFSITFNQNNVLFEGGNIAF